MYKSILLKIKNEESVLFLCGWLAIAFFSIWGNTSLGMLLLLIHTIYAFSGKRNKAENILSSVKNLVEGENRVYLLMALFLSWGILTSPFAANKFIALTSVLGYGLVIYMTLFGARKLVRYQDYLTHFIIPAFIIGTTIAASYTLITYFLYDLRRGRTLFQGTNGGGTLYIAGAILLIAFFDYLKNKKRYLLVIPIFLTIGALLVTMSRGAWLGFFAAFALYNLRSRKNLLIFLIIIILLGTIISFSPDLNKRFRSIFSLNDNRIVIWQGTIEMIKDHPLIGIGAGNYPVVYPDYRPPEDRQKNHPYAHNIFANIFAEMGIIGLALFALIILTLVKQGYILSRYNPLYRGLLTAFLGILVHQQFDCTILGFEIAGTFWLIAGLIAALYIKKIKAE